MPGRWFAGIVIGRENADRVLELLVMDCSSTDFKFRNRGVKVKFPGGTEDGHPEDGSILGTRNRELTEETGLRIKVGVEPLMVHSETPNSKHFKNFYFVRFEDCEGELRTVEKTDNGDRMSAPYWVEAQTLSRIPYFTHHGALMRVLNITSTPSR